MKKILHLNYSNSGGAGRVAQLLTNKQNDFGEYEAEFLYKVRGDLWNDPFQDIKSSVRGGIDNFVVKEYSFSPLFSMIRDGIDNKIAKRVLAHEGIIHLHWINGMIDTKFLYSNLLISKNVVWTMHDMVPITGGCHYSLNCSKYLEICEECPAVRRPFRKAVSINKIKKNLIFEKRKNLIIVVPSKWFAKKFQDIKFFNIKKLKIIPNPVEDIFFKDVNKIESRNNLKIPRDSFIIGFVSQNIDNPLKNFEFLLNTLGAISSKSKRPVVVLAIGQSKKSKIYKQFGVLVTGTIQNEVDLLENYSAVDVMVSTSNAETFGLSIAEAAAIGIPSIVLSGTATEEMVENGKTGFTVQDETEFISKVIEVIERQDLLKELGKNAKIMANSRYRVRNIIRQYDEIYNEFNM
jgi:glycosyltransferase involved in cell wall biosynthesis